MKARNAESADNANNESRRTFQVRNVINAEKAVTIAMVAS
jgi:hypothetical protein